MPKPVVFQCMPRYSASVDARAQRAFLGASRGGCITNFGVDGIGGSPIESQISVLTKAFNTPWTMALSLRSHCGITDFSMQHADVEPDYGYLDVLTAERRRVGADILSVVIPFKLPTGITSTAVGLPSWPADEVSPGERARRLTMHEIAKLPQTFTADDVDPGKVLLINTGCWVCDFTKPWVEKITFRFLDKNYLGPDGLWRSASRGEDWDFSLQAHRLGLKVAATTIVRARHHGECAFPNYEVFGSWQTDEDYLRLSKQPSATESAQPETQPIAE